MRPTATPGAPTSVGMVHPYWLYALFAILVLGYRLWVIAAGDFPLFYDEAYYLDWSRSLAWGYYSKPPAVALLLKISTALLGETSLGVKAGAAVLYGASSVVILLVGRYLYGPWVGALSGITYLSLPIVGGNSFFMTTDVPLIFFWSLALLLFLYARDRGHWGWWLALGVTLGCGMLSKYTMVVMPLGLLLYLALSPAHRRLLAGMKPWIALLVAALVFMPNVIWNAEYGFVSFRHTAEISHLDRELFHWDDGLAFIGAQFGVFGFLLMPPFIRLIARRQTYQDDNARLLLMLALPLLAVMTAQGFLAGANYNWAAPAYVSATVLTVARLVAADRRRWLTWAVVVNMTLLSLLYHYHAVADGLGINLSRKTDPYYRVLGWPEAAQQAKAWLEANPEARLASDSRDVLAYLSFYAGAYSHGLASWNPDGQIDHQYDLVDDLAKFPGADFVFISKREPKERILQSFDEVHPLGHITVKVYPDLDVELYGLLLRGFKGYSR